MIAKGAGLHLGPALQAYTRRFEQIEKGGVDLGRASFSGEFGRNLEYYSGMLFQIEAPGSDDAIGGGGRYDRLLSYLGAPQEVPAIGSALHTERLLAAARSNA
jgi:ATP phosphoribosyltransferase regulatory subunit